MKLISKFALLLVIIVILYLLISGNLISSSPVIIGIQLLAIILSIWARRSFKKGQFSINAEPGDGPLLLTGPYKFIRHPMYTFALIIVWSSVMGHASLYTIIISLVITVIIAIRIVMEEKALSEQYSEYAEYTNKTKRIIPFII